MTETSLSAIMGAQAFLDKTSARIAAPTTPKTPSVPAQGDTVDLSIEMVALMQALNDSLLNVSAVQTESNMAQSTLDVMA